MDILLQKHASMKHALHSFDPECPEDNFSELDEAKEYISNIFMNVYKSRKNLITSYHFFGDDDVTDDHEPAT